MRKLFSAIFCVAVLCLSASARPDHPLESRLVTVRVTSQTWNEYRPWQKNKPSTRTFVGTVIAGNRILMITDDLISATLIQVEKFDRPPRMPARIVHADPQIGLALITVDEPGFFDDLDPVEIAENTNGKDYFSATWKDGQLSLAASRWSQSKVFSASLPYLSYVGIYFITDLTGGGWGEPVFSEGKLVGITNSQNTNRRATVLPAELIHAYLRACEQPDYPGFAWLGIRGQMNKGWAQAAYAGQQGTPTGIRIRYCFPGASADGYLLPNDILLELDGQTIDSLGDYVHPRYGPVDLNLIATEGHYAGDTVPAKVLRNKTETQVEIPLKNIPPSAALIPDARLDTPPPYLVAGGLIFRELDVPYLKAWGDKWEDQIPSYLRCLYEMKSESQTPEKQRLIVLADVFPDEYNLGYHDMAQNIVKSVNGYPIDSIREMEAAFQQPQDGFHIIEFMPSYGASKVILDAKAFSDATARIMEKYQIPARIRTRP